MDRLETCFWGDNDWVWGALDEFIVFFCDKTMKICKEMNTESWKKIVMRLRNLKSLRFKSCKVLPMYVL